MWDLNPMYVIPDGVETRWACPENRTAGKGIAARSNGGRKGSPFLPVRAKEQVVLAQEDGTSGTIRRIWVTLDDRSPRMLRSLRLDFYWDGAERPAVSTPLGDFFERDSAESLLSSPRCSAARKDGA